MAQVLEETKFASLQDVFCGYHPGTLASCLLSFVGHSDDRQRKSKDMKALLDLSSPENQDLITRAQSALKRVAFPAAALLSESLRNLNETYFQDLWSALTAFVTSSAACMCPPALIATHSPMCSLNPNGLKDVGFAIQTTRLNDIESEQKFIRIIESHLESSVQQDSLLIIQFDPILSSSVQVTHSMFLCSRLILNRQISFKRPILFLVHIPSGVRDRTRSFVLDYYSPWTYYFVDELTSISFDMDRFLTTPLADLCLSHEVDLHELVANQLAGAVSLSRTLSTEPTASLVHRLNRLREVLRNSESFRVYFMKLVLDVLKCHSGFISGTKLPLHTSLAVHEALCGTLRESLSRATDDLILQAVTYVILFLEKNNNLSTLRFGVDFWLSLAKNPSVMDFDSMVLTARLGGKAVQDELSGRVAINTGRFGALTSRFPFSYSIISILNGADTRKAIESSISSLDTKDTLSRYRALVDSFYAISVSLFGSDITLHWEDQQLDYLHDFVSICAAPLGTVAIEEMIQVYSIIFSVSTPARPPFPLPVVHAANLICESRMNYFVSLISQLPVNSRRELLAELSSLTYCSKEKVISLDLLLVRVVDFLISHIWKEAATLPFFSEKKSQHKMDDLLHTSSQPSFLSEFISSLKLDVTNLIFDLSLVRSNIGDGSEKGKMDEKDSKDLDAEYVLSLKKKWDSILILNILLEMIIIPSQSLRLFGSESKKLFELIRTQTPNSLEFYDTFLGLFVKIVCELYCCWDCGGPIMGDSKNTLLCHACEEEGRNIVTDPEDEQSKRKKSVSYALGEGFWRTFTTGVWSAKNPSRPVKVQEASSSKGRNKKCAEKQIFSKSEEKEEEKVVEIVPEVIPVERPQRIIQPKFKLIHMVVTRLVSEVFLPFHIWPILKGVPIQPDLVTHFGRIVNNDAEHGLHCLLSGNGFEFWKSISKNVKIKEIESFDIMSSLRANIMIDLIQTEGYFHTSLFRLHSDRSKQLYLRYRASIHEESLSQEIKSQKNIPAGVKKFLLESNLDGQNIHQFISIQSDSEENLRHDLDCLAKIQVCFSKIAENLIQGGIPKTKKKEKALEIGEFYNMILSDKRSVRLKWYILKVVKALSDFEGVTSVLSEQSKLPENEWLRFADFRNLQNISDQSSVTFGPVYFHVSSNFVDSIEVSQEMETIIENYLLGTDLSPIGRKFSKIESREIGWHILPATYSALKSALSNEAKENLASQEFLSQYHSKISSMMQSLHSPPDFAVGFGDFVSHSALLINSKFKSPIISPVFSQDSSFTLKDRIFLLFQLRLVFMASLFPSSWITTLITNPMEFVNLVLPTVSVEPVLGSLQWYAF